MTLAEACVEVFRGKIEPSTLRAEAARGRLVIERIGRRDFVTRAALKEMRKLCRIPPKEPAARSTEANACNLPDTERTRVAQAAALASARALRTLLRKAGSRTRTHEE
jgi:hypothetical protein